MKNLLFVITFFLLQFISFCQIATVPSLPSTDDNITIYFDAGKGNAALSTYSGVVYLHSGVITSASTSNTDWKYTIGNWGAADPVVQMESIGNKKYKKTINIRSFYGIPQGIDVKKLAFVFRNADGSIVGRASDGTDILVIVNAYTFTNYISHTFINNLLTITAQNGKITVRPFDDNMAKIALYPDGNITTDTTFSVVMLPTVNPAILSDETAYLNLNCGELIVHIEKNPVRLSFQHNGETVFKEETGYFNASGTKGLRFKLSASESIYGTGSRAIQINRRGQKLYSYNEAHYSYTYGSSTLNINIPFVISSEKYGLYIENISASNFDIGNSTDSIFQYTVEEGNISYYIITGNTFDNILNGYTTLTGKQPLPPRWALGYMQSRFGYKTETEARSTVNDIIQDDIPIDALILDLYWFGQLSDMGNFTWNSSNWPNPTGMINDFKAKGINTILISEPYITTNSFNYSYCNSNKLFGTDLTGNNTYVVNDFYAGPSGLLDIFKSNTSDWLWSKYKARIDEGVAGWWCDVGEPENHPSGIKHVIGTARQVHNVYSLEWAAMIYNKYRQEYPNQRPFNLIRSGFAGMQRYSAFPWSGDVSRSYNGFQSQIPIMLGMSMSGIGYMHSDLGGFTGGSFDPELFTRWLQFGAFCPIMRPHGEGIAPEPIYYPAIEKGIIRDYVKLRYQLMPYIYTLSWQNTETGRPLAMPINYFEPTNNTLNNVNDEYLFGENILVAPVMNSGQTSRTVLFPSGKWIHYWTNQTYTGNISASINAPLNQMPVFIKAGSFIPMVPKYNNTTNYNTDTLLLKYYPDNSSPFTTATVYDDDGKTPFANVTGQNEQIHFSGEVLEHQTNIKLFKTGNGFVGCPASRLIIFEVQRQNTIPYLVLINGIQSTIFITQQTYTSAGTGVYFDSQNKILYVKYLWTGSNDIVIIASDNQYNTVEKIQTMSHYLQYPYPNPFCTTTTINYNILKKDNYSLSFFNSNGSLIQSINLESNSGSYTYVWSGKGENDADLPSGLYFISLNGPDGKQWMKVVKE